MQAVRDDEDAPMASLSFRKAEDEGLVSIFDGTEPPQQIPAGPRELANDTGVGEGKESNKEGAMKADRDNEDAQMASLSFRNADDEGLIYVLEGESPQQISAAPREPADETGNREGSASDDDFEFAFVLRDPETGLRITPEDIFSDGWIGPVYPVFGRRLVADAAFGGGGAEEEKNEAEANVLVQSFQHLFVEEREANPTGSASEDDDELELRDLPDVPPASYCLWRPGSSPTQCKKSNSTGSLLRWRIKDLVMGRSHSDGKEKFVFLAADKRELEKKNVTKKAADAPPKEKHSSSGDRHRRTSHDYTTPAVVADKYKGKQTKERGGSKAIGMDMGTAHRVFYGKAGRSANGGARRSFLPYKKELFGVFAGVSALNRSYLPI